MFAALPIIFHLYERMRRRHEVLPTLRFLRPLAIAEEKHRRLRERLLLALRTLAILAAVLAWARPAPILGAAKSSTEPIVILLDRSLSMEAVWQGRSRLSTAIEKAKKAVTSAAPGTVFTVIAFDDETELLIEREADQAAVHAALDQIASRGRGTDLAPALTAIPAGARVLLLSDLQEYAFRNISAGFLRDLSATIAFDEELSSGAIDNRAVTAIAIAANDTGVTVSPEIIGDISVELECDNERRQVSQGEAAAFNFRNETMVLHARLAGTDALAADDKRTWTVRLPSPPPVDAAGSGRYISSAVAALGFPPGKGVTVRVGAPAEGTAGTITFAIPTTSAPAMRLAPAVDGPFAEMKTLEQVTVTRRAQLDVPGRRLLLYEDGVPAVIETDSGLIVNMPSDVSGGAFVLTPAFPALLYEMIAHVAGSGVRSKIVAEFPSAPAEESDLRLLTPLEAGTRIGELGSGATPFATADSSQDPAEWWRIFLAVVLAVCVVETLLARTR